jgi:hypothetical protein
MHQALLAFLRAYKALVAARARLAEAAATTADLGLTDGDDWVGAAMERARRWAGAEKLGPRWCACQQALDVARDAGLSDLVERIVTGEIAAEAAADALEVGYARWWIDAVVDAEPALRGFVSERGRARRQAVARRRGAPAWRAHSAANGVRIGCRIRPAQSRDFEEEAPSAAAPAFLADAERASEDRALHDDEPALHRAVPAGGGQAL